MKWCRAVLCLCAALAVPTAVAPASQLADATYLTGLAALTAALWWSTVRAHGPLRRTFLLFAVTASCWFVGDLVQRVFSVPDATIGVPDILWISSYPLLIIAIAGILQYQGLPRSIRRDIGLDSIVISAAAGVASWHLLIAPDLGDSSVSAALLTAIYPLGDVAIFTLALTLVMLPGRPSGAGRLLIGCLALTLPLDFINVTLSVAMPSFDTERLDALFLVVNSMLAAAALHPQRDRLVAPLDFSGGHRLNRWRIVILGVSLATVITLDALPDGRAVNLIPSLGASLVVSGAVITRFYLTVREREKAETALRFQAEHDPLTGMGNRLMLISQMTRAAGQMTLHALIYIDLDGFKRINDTWGHPAGDAVLQTVATRLAALTRGPDVIARVGGDEFVVLCDDLELANAEALAHRLLAAICAPIDLGPASAAVGASIGVVMLDEDKRTGAAAPDVDDLLYAVDEIMYQAKRSGGGVVVGRPTVRALAASAHADASVPPVESCSSVGATGIEPVTARV